MEQFVVDRLRASLHERVTTPDHPDYDAARATFNATVQRRPAVIVRVRDDDDVVAAVVAAGDLDLPIAVRGGGHSVAGHAMADGALVVDLRDRRTVTVDPATRIVRVDGGALWEDVDTAAWRHHLAVVGGTVVDTGVGGLTLGGGIGWLSGLRGFTCDNLVRAEVVTAAGEKVVAGPGRRSGAAVGAARRRRQLRRRDGLRIRGHRSGTDPRRLHPLPDQRGQAGPPPAGIDGRERARRARADRADRPARRGRRRPVGPRRRLLAGRHRGRDRHPSTAPSRPPGDLRHRRADGVSRHPGHERAAGRSAFATTGRATSCERSTSRSSARSWTRWRRGRPATASSCSRRSVARHTSSPRVARHSGSVRRRGTRVPSGSGMTRRSTTASSPGRERRPIVSGRLR